MKARLILHEFVVALWSFGCVAIAYHQGKKSRQDSHDVLIQEINSPSIEVTRRWIRTEPIRAYIWGLISALAVVMCFTILTMAVLISVDVGVGVTFHFERFIGLLLAAIGAAIWGVASVKTDFYNLPTL